jgi:hypothetical protein
VIKRGPEACVIRRVPAAEIEAAIIDQVRALVRTPEIIVRTWKEALRLMLDFSVVLARKDSS